MYLLQNDLKLSSHFLLSEFACRDPEDDPAHVMIDYKLIESLESFRAMIEKPLVINSGFRTPSWNSRLNGSPRSQHLSGRAADIQMLGYDGDKILVFAVHAGFRGIGFYDGFIHLDVRYAPVNKGGRLFDFWDMRKKR